LLTSKNMTHKYFGTDGIRGRANSFPMTADIAMKVAMAAAYVLRGRRNGHQTDRVVIGKDTRLSGYMLEEAMGAGFVSMGLDVLLTGPIPTPGIAMLTRSLRADLGVMISASHNPYQDNGIKLFGADGFKLDDALESEIEAKIETPLEQDLAAPDKLGKASRVDDAPGRYSEYIKSSVPRGQMLDGLKIVVDCAHGAAYKVAPQVLWELEVEVIAIGARPDGRNINAHYGATALDNLKAAVLEHGADIGLALDGDADRLIVIDEMGRKIDGDQVMGALARHLKSRGRLTGGGIAATVMSNLGLERFLRSEGLGLERTPVGDRNVVEAMREGGYNLGGEQSGHIILTDYSTTGDGVLAGLQVLALMKESGKRAGELLNVFEPVPQILKNVRYNAGGPAPLNDNKVRTAVEKAEQSLENSGRLLVRASGTEPLIRVMAEGDDEREIENAVNEVCTAIEEVTG